MVKGAPDDRKLARMRAAATFFRRAFLISLVVNVILAAVIVHGHFSRKMAHAILVGGEMVCLVRSERAANQVREALLKEMKGGYQGEASFEPTWEDKPWPAKGEKICSNEEAIKLLKPKLHVVVEGFAIQVKGRDVIVVPTHEIAEEVLRTVKAKFLKKDETPLEPQRFEEEPVVVQTRVRPEALISDIHTAAEELLRGTTEPQEYVVKAGDVPYSVANAHNMTLEQLYALNPGLKEKASRNDIHPGDKWTVAAPRPRVVVITKKETTRTVPVPFPTVAEERASLPAGEVRVVRAGKEGKRKEWIRGTWRNDKLVPESLKVVRSQIIEEPQPKRVLKGTGPSSSPG